MAQRPHRFIEPPVLRQGDSRKRVDECEVTQVAGGMEGRRGLRDVLPDNGAVADLAITKPKLVVGEADGARIMGALCLFEGAGKKRNASRGLAVRDGQPAM
jgi:hypothetical protein